MEEQQSGFVTEADAYVKLALAAIPYAANRDELEEWWRSEEEHRQQYRITDDQRSRLAAACKRHIESLSFKSRPTKWKPKNQPSLI